MKRLIKRVADRYKTYMDWLNSTDEHELGGYYSDRYKDEFGCRPSGKEAKFDSVDDLKNAILNLDQDFIEECKKRNELLEQLNTLYTAVHGESLPWDEKKCDYCSFDEIYKEMEKLDKEVAEDEKNRYASKTVAKRLKKVAKNLEELTDEEYENLKKNPPVSVEEFKSAMQKNVEENISHLQKEFEKKIKEVIANIVDSNCDKIYDDAYFDAIEQFAPKTDFSEQDLNEIMQDTQVYKDWKNWTPEKVMAMKSTIESATKVALEDYFSEQK